MAIQVHLVRHGEAKAGWDTDPDPGLSENGWAQAGVVRDQLLACDPMPLLTSPLSRALQTAAPLADAWRTVPIIDPIFREIPAPPDLDLHGRLAWLLSMRNLDWSQADSRLLQWRAAILQRLESLQTPTVVFTHFMVLNLVAGVASGCSSLVHYQPANGSILTISIEDRQFTVLDWGQQAKSDVL